MSKHFHKHQNKKPVCTQTHFNPEGSLHENWGDGYNTGQEVGTKNGLINDRLVSWYINGWHYISWYMHCRRINEAVSGS